MTRERYAALVRHALVVLVLIASGWYIARYFDWANVIEILQRAHYSWFIFGGGALQLLYLVLRAWRWMILIRTANASVRLRDLYLPNAIVVSFAIVTPGQVGETLKIEALKQRRILGRAAGLGFLVVERTLDLVVLLLLAAVGLLSAPVTGLIESYYPLLAGVAILAAIALAVLVSVRYRGGPNALLRRTGLTDLGLGCVAAAFGCTLASWGVVALVWQIALAATGIWLSLAQTLTLLSLTTLGGLVSLVPGGLGVAEVITTELLQLYDVDQVRAQAGAIMLRLYSLLILVIGLFHLLYWWIRKPTVSGPG